MKKQFSSIFNDTYATDSPLSNLQAKSSYKCRLNQVNRITTQLESPAQLNCQPGRLQICHYCLQHKIFQQKIIKPCKCDYGVHIGCLQARINKDSQSNKENNSKRLKCQKCKQKYKVQLRNSYYLRFDKLCHFSWIIIVNYLIMTIIMGITIGLGVYLEKLNGQNQTENKYNEINKKQNKIDDPQKQIISSNELRIVIILCLIVCSLLQLMVLLNFIRHYMLQKRIVVVDDLNTNMKKVIIIKKERNNEITKKNVKATNKLDQQLGEKHFQNILN